jgi:hypothetical protein
MTYTLLAEATRTARKRHRCIWCGQHIEPGETYRDERSVYDGELQHHRWHPECDEQFSVELAYEGGGDLEFSPYDNERPAKETPHER